MKTSVRINGVVLENSIRKIEESSVLVDKLLATFNHTAFTSVEDVMLYLYRLKENMNTRHQWKHKKLRGLLRQQNIRLCDLSDLTGINSATLSLKMNGRKSWTESDKDSILTALGLQYSKQLDKELFETQED